MRYYGKDNPVDGAVIRVLLDKAKEIRQVLGTHVPVPEEERYVVEALVHALFFGQDRPAAQLKLGLEPDPVPELHRKWELDASRERESRTRFAQHALKPEEVRRELEAADQVLGDPEAVRNFVLTACQRLGVQVQRSCRHQDVWNVVTEPAALEGVPEAIRRALPPSSKLWTVTFTSPTPEGSEYLGRNHPFVTALAQYLFEQAFSGSHGAITARCGAIRTRAVERTTALLLLRLRFLLQTPDRPPLLAEEVLVTGRELYGDRWLEPARALKLLAAEPSANMTPAEKRELVAAALKEATRLVSPQGGEKRLHRALKERATELAEAHKRVRRSIHQPVRGLSIEPHWPPDLLGVLVLQPVVGGAQ